MLLPGQFSFLTMFFRIFLGSIKHSCVMHGLLDLRVNERKTCKKINSASINQYLLGPGMSCEHHQNKQETEQFSILWGGTRTVLGFADTEKALSFGCKTNTVPHAVKIVCCVWEYCVFFTLNSRFSSTPSTTSIRADSSIREKHKLFGYETTPQTTDMLRTSVTHCHAVRSRQCNAMMSPQRYNNNNNNSIKMRVHCHAVSGVDNAMP